MGDWVVEGRDLTKVYTMGDVKVHALRGLSITIKPGEVVAIMGPSGSGKSTVLRAIAGLHSHWTGIIEVDGIALKQKRPRAFRKLLQMVFQDPFGSLHPRHTIDFILKEPLAIHRFKDPEQRILKALDEVGLGPEFRFRYPHQLSGGQRQRIAIARALYRDIDLLILDEATSALDGLSEREVSDAIARLAGALTVVVIAHRLATVTHCHEIWVLDEGRLVGVGGHGSLLRSCPLYGALAEVQFGGAS